VFVSTCNHIEGNMFS